MKHLELSDSVIFGRAEDIRAVRTGSGLLLLSGSGASAMLSAAEASVYALTAKPISMAEIRQHANLPANDVRELLLSLYRKGMLSVSGRVPKILFSANETKAIHLKAGKLDDGNLNAINSYLCSRELREAICKNNPAPLQADACPGKERPPIIIEFTDSADIGRIAGVLQNCQVSCSAVIHLRADESSGVFSRITSDYKSLFLSVPSEFIVHFNDTAQLRGHYGKADILAAGGLSWMPCCSCASDAEQFFEACIELNFSCLGLGIDGAQGYQGRKAADMWLRVADKIKERGERGIRQRVHPLERYFADLAFPADKPSYAVCFGNIEPVKLSPRCGKCFFRNMCAKSGADFCQFSERLGIGIMERLYTDSFWKSTLFKAD
ncbi:MAG: hypothetical protein K6G50_02090 [bacterium]|nr:hypothetical protein [bacterium]